MLRRSLSFVLAAAIIAASCGAPSPPPDAQQRVSPAPQEPSTPPSQVAVSAGRDGVMMVEDSTPSGQQPGPGPATMSIEEGRTLAAGIQHAIDADPRLTGTRIEVSYAPPASMNPEAIGLSGVVGSDDEKDIVMAIVRKHTDIAISAIVHVAARPEDDALPGPWVEHASTAPRIPLCAGLTVVTAIASQGDYESIKTILSVTPEHVRMKYSSESSPPWWSPFRHEFKRVTTYRTILTRDLATAHTYAQYFTTTQHTTDIAPGTTAIGTSAAVLRELKTSGITTFSYCEAGDDVVYLRDGKPVETPAGCLGFTDPFPLKRVGTGPVMFDVLVDGTPVKLPAVLARGKTSSNQRVEFAFLDDESNPLTLGFRIGIGEIAALGPGTRKLCENEGRKDGIILTGGLSCDLPDGGDRDTLRVTKISTRCEVPMASAPDVPGEPPRPAGGGEGTLEGGGASGGGAAALERALIEKGSVDVYSIYFSFNSDVIRDESTPTLEDIAAILRRHPTWKLRVNGHTDSIGSDQFNLDLSRRRAEAVKHALATRYGIAADRLDTAGFGESQPKDTNDTIEGRARNRRVELMRSGS
jgi:outer membrane protein OmpA-like peptidoglycan-associated protein